MTTTAPSPVQPYLDELRQEARSTRGLFEVLPEDRLAWRPHPKSYSLGQLALHIARLPGAFAEMLEVDAFDLDGVDFQVPQPGTRAEVLAVHDAGVEAALAAFGRWDAARLGSTWRVVHGEQELMVLPRAGGLRTMLCNHVVHHRGQLTVYLRLLDVPLPSVYGPTADVNPFA